MDELIKLVTSKVGISEDQAKKAVETVIGYLKDKLPTPIAGQIDGILKGEAGGLGDVAGKLGGMFDKK